MRSQFDTVISVAAGVWLFIFSSSRINDHVFDNIDDQGLESALVAIKPQSLYLDAARPFYIQRRLPDARIFYDLNARLVDTNTDGHICEIQRCVAPDTWVITVNGKSDDAFQELKQKFSEIKFLGPKSFVATRPNLHCADQEIDCNSLRMNR
jgi:hypothetical protein